LGIGYQCLTKKNAFQEAGLIEFFVPGKPAPQGSKRHVGRGILVEASKEVGPWRERIALAAADHADTLIQKPDEVRVLLQFTLPRPASAPKTRKLPASKRPDLDKLARAVLDALTNVIFEDDSQVVSLNASKYIADPGEQPGVKVTIHHF